MRRFAAGYAGGFVEPRRQECCIRNKEREKSGMPDNKQTQKKLPAAAFLHISASMPQIPNPRNLLNPFQSAVCYALDYFFRKVTFGIQ